MNGLTQKLKTTLVVGAVAALAGCSAAPLIDSGDALTEASTESTSTLVFGKFELVRNGHSASLGNGLFSSSATLHVDAADGSRAIVGQVGDGGTFEFSLQPGEYRVTSIGFHNRGEKVETDVSLAFSVPKGSNAVYIGTLTLETVFDSGYYGLNGAVEDFTVSDDCRTDCAERLTQLDLSTDAAIVALMRADSHVASAD
ncbi:MAG: hypothetical protein QNI99_02800 [Woeseiaceae bacterium]|nr:hypothetical protein [Woeseiaceae bacterium]